VRNHTCLGRIEGICGGAVEVRPPSQSVSRVATREHFTVPVLFSLRGGLL
jgi:hypothetical protein